MRQRCNAKDHIDSWRRLYEMTASSSDWQVVHRWGYGAHIAAAVAEDVRRKLILGPEDRVLEVGCASGFFLSMLLHDHQGGFGVDHSEVLVGRSADFCPDRVRLKLGVAEAARLPFASNSFDKVFCYSVFQCFPDRTYARQTIGEFLRVCRSGGIILLGDIFGVMEKQRQRLCRIGIPESLADLLLRPAVPIWHAKQRLRAPSAPDDQLRRRVYPRSFFRRVLAEREYHTEFLPQQIDGRLVSKSRYDVRIFKRTPTSERGDIVVPTTKSSADEQKTAHKQ